MIDNLDRLESFNDLEGFGFELLQETECLHEPPDTLYEEHFVGSCDGRCIIYKLFVMMIIPGSEITRPKSQFAVIVQDFIFCRESCSFYDV